MRNTSTTSLAGSIFDSYISNQQTASQTARTPVTPRLSVDRRTLHTSCNPGGEALALPACSWRSVALHWGMVSKECVSCTDSPGSLLLAAALLKVRMPQHRSPSLLLDLLFPTT